MLIVQHMPPDFTAPFASRLNNVCEFPVRHAESNMAVEPSQVIIADGSKHLLVKKRGSGAVVWLDDSERVSGHKPSADVLMRTAAEVYGDRTIGIIMTGMGRDGATGCAEILRRGGKTLGQNQASSVIYGMNRIAQEEGAVQQQFDLDELTGIVTEIGAAIVAGRAVLGE